MEASREGHYEQLQVWLHNHNMETFLFSSLKASIIMQIFIVCFLGLSIYELFNLYYLPIIISVLMVVKLFQLHPHLSAYKYNSYELEARYDITTLNVGEYSTRMVRSYMTTLIMNVAITATLMVTVVGYALIDQRWTLITLFSNYIMDVLLSIITIMTVKIH